MEWLNENWNLVVYFMGVAAIVYELHLGFKKLGNQLEPICYWALMKIRQHEPDYQPSWMEKYFSKK